jgi:hypothetical protein
MRKRINTPKGLAPRDRAVWIFRNTELIQVASGCLNWPKTTGDNGYGQICPKDENRKTLHFRTHRLVWEMTHGPIPEGMCVCHRCDNKKCCNVEHMFLGTVNENNRDKIAKGRHRNGRGKRHDRQQIREMLEKGASCPAIARELKADLRSIQRIKSNLKELDNVWPLFRTTTRGDEK